MNLSGILVIAAPGRLEVTVERLNALDGVEVHYQDAATGKIVVVQEAAVVRDEVDGLKRIKALPDIILAEMVHHRFEDDNEILDAIPPELANEEVLDPARVPEPLQRV